LAAKGVKKIISWTTHEFVHGLSGRRYCFFFQFFVYSFILIESFHSTHRVDSKSKHLPEIPIYSLFWQLLFKLLNS